ncbi:hypothetical protein [Streptomyces sp. NPDC046759]|uniref:hypothetical protein n=1 Tax=Streptomyces sp. NPDC046759 TaxID=3155019 RepID=UPI0033F4214B
MSEPYREVYYYDFEEDFGLSGLAGTVGSGADPESVRACAARAAGEDEDYRLGTDVRLLLHSPLTDDALGALWAALTDGRFDPFGHGIAPRAWLRLLAEVCPPCTPERSPATLRVLDESRPRISEEELRAAVRAELPSQACPTVPRDVVRALRRIVDEVDADLGLRLLLRVLKASAVLVEKDRYDRLASLGDRLAYPGTAVFEGLAVRWPPLDPGRRDFASRFGLPFLAAMFDHEYDAWRWEGTGTPRAYIRVLAHSTPACAPGSQAAVLLEDVQRLLDCPLSDAAVTALWQTASGRQNARGDSPAALARPRRIDDFDLDGREWLRETAEVCTERLAEVAPGYTPAVSPPRTDLRDEVLCEVREFRPLLDRSTAGTVAADLLRQTVTSVDPDLGLRFLHQMLGTHGVAVTHAQYARHQDLGARLGYHEEYVTDRLERLLRGSGREA